MKILPIEKVREADAYTIANEPVLSIDLMERAATACFKWLSKRLKKNQEIMIFCGQGNNGGDGLVVARLLGTAGYPVKVIVIRSSAEASRDFQINFERLSGIEHVKVTDLKEGDPLPAIPPEVLVVDAIFGSGLSKPVKGFIASVINHINKSRSVVAAIDIPSGLFSDQQSDAKEGAIINADYTISFEFPKLAFMFPENDRYVGDWHVEPIGLHPEFIEKIEVKDFLLTAHDLEWSLKPRPKFSHKGHYGHALLIAGDYGKMGAAVLASMACLRSGVGLLHTHIPGKGYPVIQTAVPEAMVSIDHNEEHFSEVPNLAPYSAIGIGPGIGFDPQTKTAMKLLIQNAGVPMVFDADAITILGQNKTWISFVPRMSIYTPHPKEFERLAGKTTNDFARNKLQREFSIKHTVYVVLKGAHSAISCPDGTCYYNTTGNPGMAKGGSGDVLTGLVLGLLAQGYTSKMASLLGVYIHGLAGDYAAEKYGMEAMISGNIVEKIGKAFKSLY
jgi:hydroxyethylthiazole kinase-like uncharacterized protein yjeF